MSDRKDTEAPKIDWRAFTPADSPMTMPDVLADPRRQALATPAVEPGGAAYDFSGPVYDFSQGKQIITGQRFNLLESAAEKPVALVFGSYT